MHCTHNLRSFIRNVIKMCVRDQHYETYDLQNVFKFNAPFQKKCILSAYCWVKSVERILTYTPTQKFFEGGVNQHFHILKQYRGHLHSIKVLLEAISSLAFQVFQPMEPIFSYSVWAWLKLYLWTCLVLFYHVHY